MESSERAVELGGDEIGQMLARASVHRLIPAYVKLHRRGLFPGLLDRALCRADSRAGEGERGADHARLRLRCGQTVYRARLARGVGLHADPV